MRLSDGTRLTPEIAEDIVEQVRRAAGLASLSCTASSPQIAFRVGATLRERAAAVAARDKRHRLDTLTAALQASADSPEAKAKETEHQQRM